MNNHRGVVHPDDYSFKFCLTIMLINPKIVMLKTPFINGANLKEAFSTFQVSKILRISRNTIQTNLSSDFITPDIHRAEGPHEKSTWSRDGVYRTALYFEMVRRGWPRRKAKESSDIGGWGKVPDKHRYYVLRNKVPAHSNLKLQGSFEFVKDPTKLFGDENHDISKFIINLEMIKNWVDTGIKNLKGQD